MNYIYTVGLLITYSIPISSFFIGAFSLYIYNQKKSPVIFSAIKFSFASTIIFFLIFLMYFLSEMEQAKQDKLFPYFLDIIYIILIIWPLMYLDWCSKLFSFKSRRMRVYTIISAILALLIVLDFFPFESKDFVYFAYMMQRVLLMVVMIDCSFLIIRSRAKIPLAIKLFSIGFALSSIALIIWITHIEFRMFDEKQIIALNAWYIVFSLLFFSWNLIQALIQFDLFKTEAVEFEKKELEDFLKKYEITKREHEIIEYLMEGYSYKKIAEVCFISYHTVKVHIYNLYRKLEVSGKVELINKVKKQ